MDMNRNDGCFLEIDEEGYVEIPEEYLSAIDVKPGDRVDLQIISSDTLVIVKTKDNLE